MKYNCYREGRLVYENCSAEEVLNFLAENDQGEKFSVYRIEKNGSKSFICCAEETYLEHEN